MTASGRVKSTATSAPASTSVVERVADAEPGDQLEVVGRLDRAARLGAHPPVRARGRRPAIGSWPRRTAAVKSRSSSNGPTTASVGGAASRSAATARTSSRVTASIRARTSSTDEQLAVDQLGLADAAHPRAGVLEAEHERAAQLALAALELLGGDAGSRRPCRARRGRSPGPRRPCAGRSRRRRRTARCRRTARGSCRPSRRGRASRGPPGTAASDMPPPSAALSTPSAKRRSSVRRDAGAAEHDVGLLGRAGARRARRRRAASGAGRRRGPARASASPSSSPARPKACLTSRTTRGVVDVAGDRDDHVLRPVAAPVVAGDRRRGGSSRSTRPCRGPGGRAGRRRRAPGRTGRAPCPSGRPRAWRSPRGSRRARRRRRRRGSARR